MPMRSNLRTELFSLLKDLRMPAVRECFEETAESARKDSWSYERYLLELLREEAQIRKFNAVQRLLKQSKLPLEKNLQTFDLKRLPLPVRQQVQVLLEGGFLDNRENILAFGNPGKR